MNKKIGLIGVGNMGTAILEGLLKNKIVAPEKIYIHDKITENCAFFVKKWKKVKHYPFAASLVKECDIIILAVKPQDLTELGAGLDLYIKGKTLISILAGTPIEKIKAAISEKPARIVRAMPNLGAKVGKSVTAITSSDDKALRIAEKIFSGCGEVVQLEEKYFDLVTAISGSGPAYFFLLMELLAKTAKDNGLSEKEAQLLAVQTALGSAMLADSFDLTPAEWRERVTSKKGTTEAALKVFKKHKIADIVSEAVTAALKRGQELAKK